MILLSGVCLRHILVSPLPEVFKKMFTVIAERTVSAKVHCCHAAIALDNTLVKIMEEGSASCLWPSPFQGIHFILYCTHSSLLPCGLENVQICLHGFRILQTANFWIFFCNKEMMFRAYKHALLLHYNNQLSIWARVYFVPDLTRAQPHHLFTIPGLPLSPGWYEDK